MKYINQHRIFAILLTIAITSLIVACRGNSEAHQRMCEAENLMTQHPDSSMAILSDIDREQLRSDKERARYALLMSMALDKNYIDTTTFDVIQPAIDYYLENGTPDEKLKTNYYQGRIYQNRNQLDDAIKCFINGRELRDEASDTLAIANLLVAQATILYQTYKFKEFADNNLDAADLYSKIGKKDYEFLSLCNALDASVLEKNKHLADSVIEIANKIVSELPEFTPYISRHMISYAIVFGNDDEIKDIIQYQVSLDSLSDMDRLDVARAYLKIGDAANSVQYLNSIKPGSAASADIKYFAVKADVMDSIGDYKGAFEAYRDFYLMMDSIHFGIFSSDLLFAQQRHEMELTNLAESKKKNQIVLLCLCVLFGLIAVVAVIYYRYKLIKSQNILKEQDIRRLQLEKKQQKLTEDNLRLQLSNIEAECDSLKSLAQSDDEVPVQVSEAIKARIEMLNGLLAEKISGNDTYGKPYEEWIEKIVSDKQAFMDSTRLAFKASHPKFIEYLESHNLTKAEINYVCLYAIGLRGKEVGEYMQLKRHYNISSEIRSKLGLNEHQTNIGIYVRKLMKSL